MRNFGKFLLLIVWLSASGVTSPVWAGGDPLDEAQDSTGAVMNDNGQPETAQLAPDTKAVAQPYTGLSDAQKDKVEREQSPPGAAPNAGSGPFGAQNGGRNTVTPQEVNSPSSGTRPPFDAPVVLTPEQKFQRRDERFRARVDAVIDKVGSKTPELDGPQPEAKHRKTDEAQEFSPSARTPTTRNRAAEAREEALTEQVEQIIRKMENGITEPQRNQISLAISGFERGPKGEKEYIQVVQQVMNIAEQAKAESAPATVAKNADAPAASLYLEDSVTFSTAAKGSQLNRDELLRDEAKKEMTEDLKEITTILKNEGVSREPASLPTSGAKVTAKASVSPTNNLAAKPASLVDKAKDWINRLVKLVTGKGPERNLAATPELSVKTNMKVSADANRFIEEGSTGPASLLREKTPSFQPSRPALDITTILLALVVVFSLLLLTRYRRAAARAKAPPRPRH